MPTSHADQLPRYQQLRRVGPPLNTRLFQTLSKGELEAGAERLGLLENGTLLLDTEDMGSVLMDYCIHDVRRRGRNAVERLLADSPPAAGSDERVLLEALREARFSLFAAEEVEPAVGIHARDLLRDESLFLVDVGFGRSCAPGQIVATRVTAPERIGMTTGAPLPVGVLWPAERDALVAGLAAEFPGADFRHLSAEQAGELSATVIRACLERGAARRVVYADTAEADPSGTPVGRNDPCRCGSGQKFKKCCGRRA